MVKKYYAYLLLGKIFPKTKLGNVLLKLKWNIKIKTKDGEFHTFIQFPNLHNNSIYALWVLFIFNIKLKNKTFRKSKNHWQSS